MRDTANRSPESVMRTIGHRTCSRSVHALQAAAHLGHIRHLRTILVLRLSRVDIHRAARRHGVSEEDIAHAFEHAVTWVELSEDPLRYLVVGPDRAGNLLELVVIGVQDTHLVIHAMALRKSTERELRKGEAR